MKKRIASSTHSRAKLLLVATCVSVGLGAFAVQALGSFGKARFFAGGNYPTSVAIGNFNGDAKRDLAVTNLRSNNVSILLGKGAGAFGVFAAAGDQSNPAASRLPESADGGPIRGFGNNGRVQTAFPVKAYTRPGAPRGAVAEGIARYGKHRLILAGFASNGENNDIAVVRYLANGKLDPSFGLNGKLVTDLGDNEEGIDVAVDRQGRIVVVGFANSYALNLGDVLVARYLADGTPDDSFGMNGIASPGRGGALAVAIDSHDRVLISGGGKNDHGSYGWFVERLTPAGDPDPDFGTGGRVEGFVAEASHAVDVAIDSQDRVAFAVCGDNEKDLPDVFAAVRLLEDGTPDPTFGDGGTAKLDFGSHACLRGIAVDHRGRIVLGGERGRFVGGRESGEILVARLSGNGTLDSSFSGNGTASIAVRNSSAVPRGDRRRRTQPRRPGGLNHPERLASGQVPGALSDRRSHGCRAGRPPDRRRRPGRVPLRSGQEVQRLGDIAGAARKRDLCRGLRAPRPGLVNPVRGSGLPALGEKSESASGLGSN